MDLWRAVKFEFQGELSLAFVGRGPAEAYKIVA